MSASPACQAAIRDERAKFKRLNRFWALVYGVAAATAVASILLIVSLLSGGNNPTSIVGGIATITSGGGMAWVVTQRNRAAKDHDAAKESLRQDCAGVQTTGGLEAMPEDSPTGLDDATISALLSD